MAQVTYRGVKYDTTEYRDRPRIVSFVEEKYRGIKHMEAHSVREAAK
jgi:hypothetical protein